MTPMDAAMALASTSLGFAMVAGLIMATVEGNPPAWIIRVVKGLMVVAALNVMPAMGLLWLRAVGG